MAPKDPERCNYKFMYRILLVFICCCCFTGAFSQDAAYSKQVDALMRRFDEMRPALRYTFTAQIPYQQGSRRATWQYDSARTAHGIMFRFVVSYNAAKGIGRAEHYFLLNGELLQVYVADDRHRKPDGTLVIPEEMLWWLKGYYKNGQLVDSLRSPYGKPDGQWLQADVVYRIFEKRLAQLRKPR